MQIASQMRRLQLTVPSPERASAQVFTSQSGNFSLSFFKSETWVVKQKTGEPTSESKFQFSVW